MAPMHGFSDCKHRYPSALARSLGLSFGTATFGRYLVLDEPGIYLWGPFYKNWW